MATKKPPVTAKRKRGRPTIYSEAVVNEFIDRLSNGENIVSICKDEHMPKWSTVWHWENNVVEVNGVETLKYPDFAAAFARARMMYAEYGVHEATALSDDAGEWLRNPKTGRVMKDENGKGIRLISNEATNKAKLQVGVRQWYAERVHNRYKPKATMEQTGPNGGPLQSVNVNAATNVAELEAAVKSLLEKGV